MQRLFYTLFLVALVFCLFAIESAPSNVVGFFRYECLMGDNFIALPLAGHTSVSELIADYPQITEVKKWDTANQQWQITSTLETGMPYLINCSSDIIVYSYGDITQQPQYSLQTTNSTNANLIMIPLGENTIQTASDLAEDITQCDTVSEWLNDQQAWKTAVNKPEGWENDFEVTGGKVYFININGESIWPTDRNEKSRRKVNYEK
ncbi:MAG: hypothetical protein PHR06_06605 [Candidatus Cloacimonetes bacterium]|nr:hypothetical protein [Candidatus Cloacimonadota bacterium]